MKVGKAKKLKKNAKEPVDIFKEKDTDPKYKTELCKTFEDTKFCPYGNKCRFAHGKEELFEKANKIFNYKKKDCKSFHTEYYCVYGARCLFKHGKDFDCIDRSFYTDLLQIRKGNEILEKGSKANWIDSSIPYSKEPDDLQTSNSSFTEENKYDYNKISNNEFLPTSFLDKNRLKVFKDLMISKPPIDTNNNISFVNNISCQNFNNFPNTSNSSSPFNFNVMPNYYGSGIPSMNNNNNYDTINIATNNNNTLNNQENSQTTKKLGVCSFPINLRNLNTSPFVRYSNSPDSNLRQDSSFTSPSRNDLQTLMDNQKIIKNYLLRKEYLFQSRSSSMNTNANQQSGLTTSENTPICPISPRNN